MMDDLRALYEEVILDHNKNPRNFGKVPDDMSHCAHGDNPLCGDQYTIYLTIENDTIADVGFEGVGCAISKASASMMLENIKGKTVAEAKEQFQLIRHYFTEDVENDEEIEKLGKMEALSGVKEFPMRVKCATLSWHIMKAAIEEKNEEITTE